MREPPALLVPEALYTTLQAAYGLAVAELNFLPIGHDSAAWVYQLRTTEGATFFLKVRASIANEAALYVPQLLHTRGIAEVVAPIPTRSATLWAAHGCLPFRAGCPAALALGGTPPALARFSAHLHRRSLCDMLTW
jgi:hypothetical protein